jgi:hypothetical protein
VIVVLAGAARRIRDPSVPSMVLPMRYLTVGTAAVVAPAAGAVDAAATVGDPVAGGDEASGAAAPAEAIRSAAQPEDTVATVTAARSA